MIMVLFSYVHYDRRGKNEKACCSDNNDFDYSDCCTECLHDQGAWV